MVLTGCGRNENFVVVYTSQDQVYAESVFEGFKKHTGIDVRPVYDSEAVKTVGLVNRLLAEQNNPQCDVFWNNEELRTRQLERAGVLRETDPWAAFGYRKRQLVINTNQLNNPDVPRTLLGLTNSVARGKVAVAYPMFGTTSTHFLALRQMMGEAEWERWCRALVANKPFLVDGNSVVVKMVGTGQAWIGLTDSDDIKAAQREGMPVSAIDLEEHGFLIRNTVGVIRHAPRPQRAQAFFEFLQKDVVNKVLMEAGASEGSLTKDTVQRIDWDELLRTQEAGVQRMKEIFLR
ncbi:MAG: extracellular solute-binding protein [Limisphaerales bacterium]